MTLNKVISGGQIGVDMMGIMSAKACGIPTGGTAPKDFRTRNGKTPHLKDFGLVESTSTLYPPRTKANVNDSDGTIRIAHNFNTSGERCTLKFIKQLKKPHYDIPLSPDGVIDSRCFNGLVHFIEANEIEVLNIAGNANLTDDQTLEVVHFLVDVFGHFGHKLKAE